MAEWLPVRAIYVSEARQSGIGVDGLSEEFEVRPSKAVMTSLRFNLPETVERRVPDSPCEVVLVIAAFYNPSQTYRVENSPVVFVLFQGLHGRRGV